MAPALWTSNCAHSALPVPRPLAARSLVRGVGAFNHLLRGVAPQLVEPAAQAYDVVVRHTFAALLGIPAASLYASKACHAKSAENGKIARNEGSTPVRGDVWHLVPRSSGGAVGASPTRSAYTQCPPSMPPACHDVEINIITWDPPCGSRGWDTPRLFGHSCTGRFPKGYELAVVVGGEEGNLVVRGPGVNMR